MALNKIKIFRWVKIFLLIYCTIGIVLYYLQDKFLFHPKKLTADHVFKFDQKFEEVNIPFNETDTMNMVKFLPDDSVSKGVVIYYHGNMENIERYAGFAKEFTAKGYEVWMEDYPGFGKSTGDITEEKLYKQAVEVKRMADARFSKDSIIIYGKSLGTGIAAYVAAHSDAKLLLLETPYYSIPALFGCHTFIYPVQQMSTYKIPTHTYLEEVKYPVVIFQGTSDGVVPYCCAKRLQEMLKPGDKFISIEGGSHNNLGNYQQFHQQLDSLLLH